MKFNNFIKSYTRRIELGSNASTNKKTFLKEKFNIKNSEFLIPKNNPLFFDNKNAIENNLINPIKANRRIFSIKLGLIFVSLFLLFSTIALAIPNTLTLQGKLTNLAGASQQGTFNFTFRIYDSFTSGNRLWEIANYTLTTDSNGVYDVILSGLNLSFADQYYLGIAVDNDGESSPRINLTSSPYSFRANVSEGLNANNTYTVRNLNVTQNFFANNTLFVINDMVGIGTISPQYLLQVANVSNAVNLSGIFYINGSSGNVGIGTTGPRGLLHLTLDNDDTNPIFRMERGAGGQIWGFHEDGDDFHIKDITAGADRLAIEGSGNVGIGTTSSKYKLDVNGTINATGILLTNNTLSVTESGLVGIGTATPTDTLTVVGSAVTYGSLNATYINASYAKIGKNLTVFGNITTQVVFATNLSGSLSCSNIIGSPDSDFCTDSTGGSSEATNNSDANVTSLRVKSGGINSSGDINSTTNIFSPFINSIPNTSFVITDNLSAYIRSSDFNLNNISNYTQYLTALTFVQNITNFLGGTDVNASLIKVGNLSTLNTLDLYIRVKDFNLGNISNDSLKSADNATFALWNMTIPISATQIQLFPRFTNTTIQIGNFNHSLNYTDILTIFGSVVNYGSLNATFINATRLLQGGLPIQLSRDFNLGNISNYTQYATQANIRTNITDYLGGQNSSLILASNLTTLDTLNLYIRSRDFNLGNISNYTQYATQSNIRTNITDYLGGQNSSLILTSNLTTLNTLDLYIRVKDFNLGNISNDSLKASNNASIALWNRTVNNIYPRELAGLVGIGTPVPDNKLTIAGNDADSNLATPGLLHLNLTDNNNNTMIPLLTLDHLLANPNNVTKSIDGGSNLGLGILMRAINNLSMVVNVSLINATLVNANNGTEASALSFYTLNSTPGSPSRLVPRLVLNGSDVFIAPNGGNVGIGTAGPRGKMELGSGQFFIPEGTAANPSIALTTAVDGNQVGFYGVGTGSQSLITVVAGGAQFSVTNGEVVVKGDNRFGFGGGGVVTGDDTNLARVSAGVMKMYNAQTGALGTFIAGNVGIGTTSPQNTLHVNGTGFLVTNTTGTANVFVFNATTGFVGINTLTPMNELTVVGSVSTFGSLNATNINATTILQGGLAVQLSRDFNLNNISNYTQYATQANVRTNITDYLGNTNASRILSTNLSTLDTLDLYIRVKDFNLGNISNNTGLNVNNNNTMALWNISIPDSATQIQIFPRFTNSTIQIGDFNHSLNYTDVMTILGSVVNYGSLNATNINATRFLQGGLQLQLSRDFNLGNISNYTEYQRSSTFNLGNISNYTQYATQANVRTNITDYLGNTNASRILSTNLSTLDTLDLYIRVKDFNLGNISNDSLKATNNASIALWNRTVNNIYPRELAGLVGIGTPVPDNKLTIAGNDADSNLATPGLLHLNLTDNNNDTMIPLLTLDHLLVNPNNVTKSIDGNSNLGLGILMRAINNLSMVVNVSLINATLVNGNNGSEQSVLSFYTLNSTPGYPNKLVPRLMLNGSNVFIAPNGGKVGIGTTAPVQVLDVVGNVRFSGDLIGNSADDFQIYDRGVSAIRVGNGRTSFLTEIGLGASPSTPDIFFTRSSGDLKINFGTVGVEKVRITLTGNVGIGTTSPNYKLDVNGTINATGILLTNNTLSVTESGLVGIGTATPTDTLTVVGSAVTYGTLNATFINATRLLQGGNAVLLSRDFNLGNISNYTQYATQANVRTNISDFLGQANGSLILAGNLSTLDRLDLYIRVKDFNLANISNDSLRTVNNASMSLWNISIPDATTQIFPRITNSTIQIGDFNHSLNYTDVMTILGSVVNYGSFNATNINATRFLQGGFQLQLSKDFNLGNISNYTQYQRSSDFNLGNISNYTQYTTQSNIRTNITDYLGGQNGSLILTSNLTTLNTLDLYIRVKDFNLGNISNSTIRNDSDVRFRNVNVTSNLTVIGNITVDSVFALNLSGKLSCSNIIGSPDSDFCTDSTGGGSESTNNSAINVTDIIARQGINATQDINTTKGGFYQGGLAVQLSSDFNLGNISNNTLVKGDNDSIALWNRTSTSTFLRFTSDNVGIGTPVPDNKLTIAGNDIDNKGLLHLNLTDNNNNTMIPLLTLDHLLANPNNVTKDITGNSNLGLGILMRAINNLSMVVNVSLINATLVNGNNGTEASALSFYTLNSTPGSPSRLVPRLVLNGSDVIIAPNGGKVGIGTANPSSILHLVDTSDSNRALVFEGRDDLGGFQLRAPGDNIFFSRAVTRTGAPALTIYSGDYVGIGTTTPNNKLDVAGTINASGLLLTNNTFSITQTGLVGIGTTTPTYQLHALGNASLNSTLYVVDNKVGVNVTYPAQTLQVAGTLNITSQPTRSGDLFVASTGKVGINTTSPIATLSVEGNFTTSKTNSSIGNMTMGQFNSSCVGFRAGATGGWILSCSP